MVAFLNATDFDKFVSNNKTFYKERVAKTKTYAQAVQACSNNGYDLANINDYLSLDDSDMGSLEKSLYWSIKSPNGDAQKAYYFSAPDMDVNLVEKTANLFFLCTNKAERTNVKDRFQKKQLHIVDKHNKIFWQLRQKTNDVDRYGFFEAKKYCENLNIDSIANWRLPTLQELSELSFYKIDNEKQFLEIFPDNKPKYYRSSNEAGDFSNMSLVVGFKIGSIASLSNKEPVFVRCVKDISDK